MATAAFTPGPTYSNTYSYTADGKWLDFYEVGKKDYDIAFVESSGLDGVGSKNYGYRGRIITLNVVYVAASENACHSTADTDEGNLTPGPTQLAMNGITYYGVFLEDFRRSQVKDNGLPTVKYYMNVQLVLNARRLA